MKCHSNAPDGVITRLVHGGHFLSHPMEICQLNTDYTGDESHSKQTRSYRSKIENIHYLWFRLTCLRTSCFFWSAKTHPCFRHPLFHKSWLTNAKGCSNLTTFGSVSANMDGKLINMQCRYANGTGRRC